MHNSRGRLRPNRILSTATTRKIPTPTATVQMRTSLGMEGTWLARTCRSGSAMVMMMPITKQTVIRTYSFFVFMI